MWIYSNISRNSIYGSASITGLTVTAQFKLNKNTHELDEKLVKYD